MITEKDLQEAISECQGQRNPNANTCIKLAAYLTIQKELYPKAEEPVQTYSYMSGSADVIEFDSESEFAKMANGKSQDFVMPVIDELMEALNVLNPRLYESVLRKLQ